MVQVVQRVVGASRQEAGASAGDQQSGAFLN
jgi:hypothetical protein